jgi:hypothetical protein
VRLPRPFQELFSEQSGAIQSANLLVEIAFHRVPNTQGAVATEAFVRQLTVDDDDVPSFGLCHPLAVHGTREGAEESDRGRGRRIIEPNEERLVAREHQQHSRRFLDWVNQIGREVVTERGADRSVEVVPHRVVGDVLLDDIEPVAHRASETFGHFVDTRD